MIHNDNRHTIWQHEAEDRFRPYNEYRYVCCPESYEEFKKLNIYERNYLYEAYPGLYDVFIGMEKKERENLFRGG